MTDIFYNKKIASLVNHFANTAADNCPYISFRDTEQDLWVEICEIAQNGTFKKSKSTIETFLWRHLGWRVQNMISDTWNRHHLMKEFTAQHDVAEVDVSLNNLCNQVRNRLNSLEKKIFEQYIDPDLDLLHSIDLNSRSSNNFNQTRLASFLDVNQMAVSRAMKKIRRVTKDVVSRSR